MTHRPNTVILIAFLFLILPTLGLFRPIVKAISPSIVISEFRTRGPNGGNDEFIELYNLSASAVNIGNWQVKGSNAGGTVSVRAVIQSGTILGPHCHYLLTNSSPNGGPYSGAVSGDQTYGVGITDDGGIAIETPDDVIVDQVGMSNGSAFKEGSPLAPNANPTNHSYERRPGGAAGSTQDTDNNQADFRAIAPSAPENRASLCGLADGPTNPMGSGSATPISVVSGGTSLLRVSVVAGMNPLSTGLTVNTDLSGIGGSSNQQFFDDGTNGDLIVGDNVFSYRATVASSTIAGSKSLPVTIRDAQSRSASTIIVLGIELPDDACSVCGVERWSIKTGTDPEAKNIDLANVLATTDPRHEKLGGTKSDTCDDSGPSRNDRLHSQCDSDDV